jgi:hypothetical protein
MRMMGGGSDNDVNIAKYGVMCDAEVRRVSPLVTYKEKQGRCPEQGHACDVSAIINFQGLAC